MRGMMRLAIMGVPGAQGEAATETVHAAIEYLQSLEICPLIFDMHTLRSGKMRNFGTAGEALDGTLLDIEIVPEGPLGDASFYNGTTSAIEIPNHTSLATLNEQEWAFLATPQSAGEGNIGALAIWGNGTTSAGVHAILFFNGSLASWRTQFGLGGGKLEARTTTGVAADYPALLFVQHDTSANKARIYSADTGTITEYAYSTSDTRDATALVQTNKLYIGNRESNAQTWHGSYSLVACANRSLTPSERLAIAALVGKGAAPEDSTFMLTADSAALAKYGMAYPLTYQFAIPAAAADLAADVDKGAGWTALPIKITTDAFNGIDAVRFDYVADKAYVSVAIGDTLPQVALRFKDASGDPVVCTYEGICKYYDNRAAAVTVTADDWRDTYNADFVTFAAKCAANGIWHTPAIITGLCGETEWAAIQAAIDDGFCEPGSHTAVWGHPPYATESDYVDNIGGAVEDITGNLTLPAQNVRGVTQYVPAFITPGGATDPYLRSVLADYGHIVDRSTEVDDDIYHQWDYVNNVFLYDGYSIRIGSDGTAVLATLNAKFDAVYGAGGIYHLMTHPYNIDYESYGDDHLAYIAGKTDVWYVGYGHLYLYRYCALFDKVTVTGAA